MKKKFYLILIISLLFFCMPSKLLATLPAEINDNSVRIRSGAGTNYSILYTLSAGTEIDVVDTTLYSGTGCSAKWYKVNYKGSTGYACSAYVTLINTSYSGMNVVDYTARVNTNDVNVRKGASTSSTKLDTLTLGANVQIVSTVTANNSGCSSNKWHKIIYYTNKVGYICSSYVYRKADVTSTNEAYAQTLRNKGFPDSYIPYLTYLHNKYPNWNFIAKNTNKNFTTAVDAEEGKNYMQTTNNNYRTSTTPAEGSSWFKVNSGVIAFYMDPRNWLVEERMFMFEKLDYDATYESQYPSLIKAVFHGGTLSQDQYTIPMFNSSKKYQVSPLHVASRIRLEVGANGSASTSGGSFTYKGKTYSGYYNFFNIGAYEKDGYSSVVNGLVTAMNNGWNTIEKAIDGGVAFLANGYINQGQGTLYYQKFNVRPGATYSSFTHQYMTNIQAPAIEGAQTYSSYKGSGIVSNTFIFEIPVYKNMPDYTSLPGEGDTNNYLKSLSVKNHEISPAFDRDVLTYEVEIDSSETQIEILAQADSTKATLTNPGIVQIDSTNTVVAIKVKPQSGQEKTYTITVIVNNNGNTTNTDNNENNNNNDSGDDNTNTNTTTTNNTTTSFDTIINNSNITVTNNNITSIKYNTKVQDIVNKLIKAGAKSVVIKNSSNVVITNSKLIGTGSTISITNENQTKSYKVIIKGDTSGDGVIDTLDLLQVLKHIRGDKKLTSYYLQAGDTSKDNKIDTLDLLQILKHIRGDKKL